MLNAQVRTTLVCILSFLPNTLLAQSASISGVIKDPQQALVPGAEVTLRSTRSAATPTVVSDGEGRYRFGSLVPGSYTVEVYLSGFEVQVSPIITVTEAQSTLHDFVLALAGETQSVTESKLLANGKRKASRRKDCCR